MVGRRLLLVVSCLLSVVYNRWAMVKILRTTDHGQLTINHKPTTREDQKCQEQSLKN